MVQMKRKIFTLIIICGIIEGFFLLLTFIQNNDLYILNHNVHINEILLPSEFIKVKINNSKEKVKINEEIEINGDADEIDQSEDLTTKPEENVENGNEESEIHSSNKSVKNDEELSTETMENPSATKTFFENKLRYFSSRLTIKKKEKMMNVFRVFIKQLELYNLTYMAYGGTLIGINRHHGLIPWDDDIDVLIDSKEKILMKYVMRKLQKTHKLYVIDNENPIKWKFFSLDGPNTEGFDFKYPYIDIFSMHEISQDEVIVEGEDNSNMELHYIYPLIKRPFNGIAVYSPCNMDMILENTYTDFDKCSNPYYSHEFEVSLETQWVEVDCNMLKEYFPFVKRYSYHKSGKFFKKELLIRNDTILQIATYSMPAKCTNKRSFYPSDLEITTF